ncbi:pleckstrin homology domain-containing family G member 5-like [Saccoglossus kowalevskii]|uniref:Pleckstrin homology domain-containing family G member 5-like n=1 Tax=Saccoglossus kowalevskii TaxID=10224 RepID=A0ABM0GMX0_SACKO|nr:PREDICTED: pleckstrin homology domain-containing family G member 5-like [Saccoglossus kowalevskii]
MPRFDLGYSDAKSCQLDGCTGLPIKICHHRDCRVQNNHQPLVLCESCDIKLHSEAFDGHPRFDLRPHGTSLSRSVSTRSCPADRPMSDPETIDSSKDDVTSSGVDDEMKSPSKDRRSRRSVKLQRKKAYRRHHTDDQSREWFSLKFDISDKDDVEIVSAIKGRSLRDALECIFMCRKMSLDSVNIFLDQSNTPLPLQLDTYPLGGHSLTVKAKDPVKDAFRRSSFDNTSARTRLKSIKDKDKDKLKGSQRGLKNIISYINDSMSPSVPTSPLPSGGESIRRTPFRLGEMFMNKDKERMNTLTEKLDFYSVHGIPDYPDTMNTPRKKNKTQNENLYALGAWTDIVDGVKEMGKRGRDQQEAIWEIMVTEVTYINKLKVITDVFYRCLLNLQNEGILNEIDSERLFSNVLELLEKHEEFWVERLVKIVQYSKQTKQPLSAVYTADAFSKFDRKFGVYMKYCIEEFSCVNYMKTQIKENELFKTYVEWCENQRECNRLKLSDLLVEPLQRLTKYPLLLKAVYTNTLTEANRDKIHAVIKEVERFIFKINRTLKLRHERKKLDVIQSKIESYDVIDTANEELSKLVEDYTHFNLSSPMLGANPTEQRMLLLEGPVRLKDKDGGKIDVLMFLFSDILLITKPTKKGDRVKIIKPVMRVDRIILQELKDSSGFLLVYLDDHKLAMWVYTLQVTGVGQSRVWLQHVHKAKQLYREIRHRCNFIKDENDEDKINKTTPQHKPTSQRRSSASSACSDSFSVSSISPVNLIEESQGHEAAESQGHEAAAYSLTPKKSSNETLQRNKSRTPMKATALPLSTDMCVSSSEESSPRESVRGRNVLPNMLNISNKLGRSVSDKSTQNVVGMKNCKSKVKKRMSWGPSSSMEEVQRECHTRQNSDTTIIPVPRIIEHKATSMIDISTVDPETDYYVSRTKSMESVNAESEKKEFVSPSITVRECVSETSILEKVENTVTSKSKSVRDISKSSPCKEIYKNKTLPNSKNCTTPWNFVFEEEDMKDGIKSIRVEEAESGHRRKLTHADIVRLRKNLILTATTTASEV